MVPRGITCIWQEAAKFVGNAVVHCQDCWKATTGTNKRWRRWILGLRLQAAWREAPPKATRAATTAATAGSQQPTAHSQRPTRTTAPQSTQGESNSRPFGYGVVLVVVVLVLVLVACVLGEVKARPRDIISFSWSYLSKSKVPTSNSLSNPTSLGQGRRIFIWSFTAGSYLSCFHCWKWSQMPSPPVLSKQFCGVMWGAGNELCEAADSGEPEVGKHGDVEGDCVIRHQASGQLTCFRNLSKEVAGVVGCTLHLGWPLTGKGSKMSKGYVFLEGWVTFSWKTSIHLVRLWSTSRARSWRWMLPGRWTRWRAADFYFDSVDIMNRGWFILHSSIEDIEKSNTVMLNAVSSSALWWEAHKSPWVAGWIREAGGLQALQESIVVTCRCFCSRRWQHSFSKILTRRLSDDWGP